MSSRLVRKIGWLFTFLTLAGVGQSFGRAEVERGFGNVGSLLSKELKASGCNVVMSEGRLGTSTARWVIARSPTDKTIRVEGAWAEDLLATFTQRFGAPAHLAPKDPTGRLYFAYGKNQCGALVYCSTEDSLKDAGLKAPVTEVGISGGVQPAVVEEPKESEMVLPGNSALNASPEMFRIGITIEAATAQENGSMKWSIAVTNGAPRWVIIKHDTILKVLHNAAYRDSQSNIWRIVGTSTNAHHSTAMQSATIQKLQFHTGALQRVNGPSLASSNNVPQKISYAFRGLIDVHGPGLRSTNAALCVAVGSFSLGN
jgi:hypothetical protein